MEKYIVPEMELVEFDSEDIIVTSGGSGSLEEFECPCQSGAICQTDSWF